MSDVFISYAREDRSRAEALAHALEARGWSVWWDRSIPAGRAFDDVIEEAIDAAACVVVLWSKSSVASRWVRTEAAEGEARNVLFPVLIEEVQVPLAFRRLQAADLTGWDGAQTAPAVHSLVADLAAILGPPASQEARRAAADPAPVPPWSRGWLIWAGGAVATVVLAWALIGGAGGHDTPELPEEPPPAAVDPEAAHQTPPSSPLCEHAGAYSGTLRGGIDKPVLRNVGIEVGRFLLLVDGRTGDVTGLAYFVAEKKPLEQLHGATPIRQEQNLAFVSQSRSEGLTLQGRFPSPTSVSGTWEYQTGLMSSGSFEGRRLGASSGAEYRFAGLFTGDDSGVFALDVDGSDGVSGIAYSITEGEVGSVVGHVSGTDLTAAADGTVIAGTLDKSTGTLWGSWKVSQEDASGTFSGSGCTLVSR